MENNFINPSVVISFETILCTVKLKGVDFTYSNEEKHLFVHPTIICGGISKCTIGGIVEASKFSFFPGHSSLFISLGLQDFPFSYSKYALKIEGLEQNQPTKGSSESFISDCSAEILCGSFNLQEFKSPLDVFSGGVASCGLEIPEDWFEFGKIGKSGHLFWDSLKEGVSWSSVSSKKLTAVLSAGEISTSSSKAFVELISEKGVYYTTESGVKFLFGLDGVKAISVGGFNMIVGNSLDIRPMLSESPLKMSGCLSAPTKVFSFNPLELISMGLSGMNLLVGKLSNIFMGDNFGSMMNKYIKDSSVFKDSASKVTPDLDFNYKDILVGGYESYPQEVWDFSEQEEESSLLEEKEFESEEENWLVTGKKDGKKMPKKLLEVYSSLESTSKNPFKMPEEAYTLEYEKYLENKKK